MAIGGVVINWASNTRDAIGDTDRLARSVDNVGDKAKKSGGALSKIGKAATAGIAGVGLIAAGAAVAFVDMAKAAYQDKIAQDKLVRTLDRVKGVTGKAAEATGSWIDKMELATLVSDDQLRRALGNLTLATGDLTEAQKLAALAQDAAVGSGREFAGISVAMAKAAEGNTAALRRMFPFLDAGPDKVLTLAEAVQQLTDKFGGAAEAAADTDVFGRLTVAWGQIKEAIGTAALPVLEEVSEWFADPKHVADIERWITQLPTWATEIGEDVKGKITDFIEYLKSPEGKEAIEDFTDSLKGFATAVGQIASAIDSMVGPFQRLKAVTDWLPSNVLTRILSGGTLYPGGGGTNPHSGGTTREGYDASDQITGGEHQAGRPGVASVTNITVNNPAPERATTSVASALRVGRPAGYTGGGAW
jgi:hypothetical protein